MRDIPILFKGPLVRSILRDTDPKTQTRRLLTRLRGFGQVREFERSDTPRYDWHFRDHRGIWNDISDRRLREVLPYQTGDRLWVRETWATCRYYDPTVPRFTKDSRVPFWYQADDSVRFNGVTDGWTEVTSRGKWRPSIHMPRCASRIDLEITEVRVQPLQEITEEDARAEGKVADDISKVGVPCFSARQRFAESWDTINGKRASWDSNPYVLAVTFRRIRP